MLLNAYLIEETENEDEYSFASSRLSEMSPLPEIPYREPSVVHP